ncbi:RecB family exonuclease [Helicobacter himalayensis]|uniref:RecB family exonuclease n=1 Tax=Helicobacter himalayensis TaxID=1591088 RepID=UPI003D7009FF
MQNITIKNIAQTPASEDSLRALTSSTLYVYSSKRSMLTHLQDGRICEPSVLISEFFSKAIFYENRILLPNIARKFILSSVLRSYEFEELRKKGLIFEKSFLAYLQSSEFFLEFFDELFLHNIPIDKIPLRDTYGEYEDHLKILQAIKVRYDAILQAHDFVYKSRDFSLSLSFLGRFKCIKLFISGVLNPFELEILRAVSEKCEVLLCFELQKQKFWNIFDTQPTLQENTHYEVFFPSGKVLDSHTITKKAYLHAKSLNSRIEQVGAINSQIFQWLKAGVTPEQITLVLPKSNFMRYLQTLDLEHNFNYAFGKPFIQSDFYANLVQILDETLESSAQELAQEPFSKKLEWLKAKVIQSFEPTKKNLANLYQKMLEILSEYVCMEEFLGDVNLEELAKYFLQEVQSWNIDDVSGGRINVMEVLESRALKLEYVIVPDCNEAFIPSLKESDLFLNTSLRQQLGIPTIKDKKFLQISYYKHLLQSAKEALVLFVEDEDNARAGFVDELGIKVSPNESSIFTHHLTNAQEYKPERYFGALPAHFSPTSFTTFLFCKQKFYFHYLQNLRAQEDASSAATLGTVLHSILERCYQPYVGKIVDSNALKTIKDSAFAILHKQKQELFSLQIMEFELMECHLARFFAREEQFITEDGAFEILGLEIALNAEIEGFHFYGKADRIQRLQNGKVLILDYKYKDKVEATKDDFSLELYKQMYGGVDTEILCAFYDIKAGALCWDCTTDKELSKTQALKNILQEIREDFTLNLEQINALGNKGVNITKDSQNMQNAIYGEFTQRDKACNYCNYKMLCGR